MKEKENILREILRLLNEKYPHGLYQYLYQSHPNLYLELQGIESQIDSAFLSGTVGELKKVLREYWTFHMRAIDIFRNAEAMGEVNNTRQEMMEKRLNA